MGMVGLGMSRMTALVQSVGHERKVLDYFHVRMWVSVSQNSSSKNLLDKCCLR